LRCDARLVERRRVDQVANGFRPRQVDTAIEIRAESEFARLGQSRAAPAGALERVTQHHGRSVAGDLYDVFGRIGSRRGKISNHYL